MLKQDPDGGTAEEGSTVRLTVSGGPGDVTVPSVDGRGQRRAIAMMTNAGLQVDNVEEQPDDSVPEGRVIRSSPNAGLTVPRGTAVTLLVSSGPKQVKVPDVTGLTQEDAQQTLTGQGFRWTVVEEESDEAAPGIVLRQTPAGDSDADPDSSVELVVAKEIPQVTVPDVRTTTLDDAAAALTAAGLEPRVTPRTVNDPALEGTVIGQRPPGGTIVNKGAPVRLFAGSFVEPLPGSGEGGTE